MEGRKYTAKVSGPSGSRDACVATCRRRRARPFSFHKPNHERGFLPGLLGGSWG